MIFYFALSKKQAAQIPNFGQIIFHCTLSTWDMYVPAFSAGEVLNAIIEDKDLLYKPYVICKAVCDKNNTELVNLLNSNIKETLTNIAILEVYWITDNEDGKIFI